MNKARMISFVVTLSVLVASSSGFARGLSFFLRKGQQLGRVVDHPGAFGAGSDGSERSRPVSSRAPAQRFHADLTGGSGDPG